MKILKFLLFSSIAGICTSNQIHFENKDNNLEKSSSNCMIQNGIYHIWLGWGNERRGLWLKNKNGNNVIALDLNQERHHEEFRVEKTGDETFRLWRSNFWYTGVYEIVLYDPRSPDSPTEFKLIESNGKCRLRGTPRSSGYHWFGHKGGDRFEAEFGLSTAGAIQFVKL